MPVAAMSSHCSIGQSWFKHPGLLAVFTDFIRWIRQQIYRGKPSIWPERVTDTPDDPKPGIVYLIGDTPVPWCAAFKCPCGCEETVSLSLIPDDRPRWRARTFWDGTVSLHP